MKTIFLSLFFALVFSAGIAQFSVGYETGINFNSQEIENLYSPKESWVNTFNLDYKFNGFSSVTARLSFTQNNDEFNYIYNSNFPFYQTKFYGLPERKLMRFYANLNFVRFSLNYAASIPFTDKINIRYHGGLGVGYLYSIWISAYEKNPRNNELFEEEYTIRGETDRSRFDPFVEGGLGIIYKISNKFNLTFNSNLIIGLTDLNKNQNPVINNAYQNHQTVDISTYRTRNLSLTIGIQYELNFKNNEN